MKLNESGLARIYQQTLKHDSGTISAFRSARDCNNGEKYTRKEKMKLSRELNAKLLKLGYGVTQIQGVYIENYKTPDAIEVKETSYIVVDLKDGGNLKKDLIKLGLEYEQDSITYQSHKDNIYYLIGTSKCENSYPGAGKVGVEVKLGKTIFGKDGEFHSQINGRPFIFSEDFSEDFREASILKSVITSIRR